MSDREKLIELLDEAYDICQRTVCSVCVHKSAEFDCSINLTADHLIANGVTAQKHGRWIYHKNYTGKNKDVWICSNCGHRCALRKNQEGYTGMTNEDIMKEHKKWCPNCGSKNEV